MKTLTVIFPRGPNHDADHLKFTVVNGEDTEVLPIPTKQSTLTIGAEVGDLLELSVCSVDANGSEYGFKTCFWSVMPDDVDIDMNEVQVIEEVEVTIEEIVVEVKDEVVVEVKDEVRIETTPLHTWNNPVIDKDK